MKSIIFFLFVSVSVFAQNTYFVKDKKTQSPIAYASIYNNNGTFKINSENDGSFIIPEEFKKETFIIESIGYETIETNLENTVIFLEDKAETLEELVIIPKLGTKEIKIGSVKKSNAKFLLGTSLNRSPIRYGRFFPYEDNFNQTPYLKDVSFLLESEEKDSTYDLKVYAADENGKPKELLHDELILGIAKKGFRVSKIDVSDYNILIPETGIIIVFDWISIQENVSVTTIIDSKSKEKINKEHLNPFIKVRAGTKVQSIINFKNHGNIWESYKEHNTKDSRFKTDEIPMIMCEITLTN